MEELICKMESVFEFFVKCGITVPATILIVPLYILLVTVCFVYRQFVILLARNRLFGNQDLSEPLDVGSALLAQSESPFKLSPSMVIIPMAVVKGVPDIHKIKEIWRARLFRKKDKNGEPFYPELLQSLEYFMGYPFWKRVPGMTEDKVLEKHFTVHKKIGGWDPTSLGEFTKSFSTKQFKEGEPLWEMAILEGYTVPGRTEEPHFAMLGRFQHTLTDGAGCLPLLQNLGNDASLDFENMKPPIPPGYYIHKFCSPIYRGTYDLVSFLINGAVLTTANSVWPKRDSLLGSDGIIPEFSVGHSFGTTCATLTTVRKVSKAWGISGTSVILTAILRSVRKVLFAGEVVLPTYVQGLIPIASPEHNGKLRNKILAIGPPLPLYVENPIIHGKGVDKGFQTSKTSSLPCTLELFQKLGGMAPKFGKESSPSKTEFVCLTTLIGPKKYPDICGYATEEFGYLLPLANGERYPCFQLMSVADKLYLSLTANKSLIEDDATALNIVNGFHNQIASFENVYRL